MLQPVKYQHCVLAYCVLMNQRLKELSLLQKLNTVTLGVGHATKKVKLFYCTKLWHFDQIFLLILGDTLQQIINYDFSGVILVVDVY